MIFATSITSLANLLESLMPHSFQELVQALTELVRVGSRIAVRLHRHRNLYEVLEDKVSLQLLDTQGRRAVHLRQERLQFVRDQVGSLYQYGWGTGDTFASHRVSPGHIVEQRKIGPRYRSLVVLPKPQQRGDELTLTVRRMIRQGKWGKRNWL